MNDSAKGGMILLWELLTVIQCVSKYFKCFYNIPRARLLNRSPVPAMDLKSNRSGL